MEVKQETGPKKSPGDNLEKLHGNMGWKTGQHMLEAMSVIITILPHLEMCT